MEAGKTVAVDGVVHTKLDLIDAMIGRPPTDKVTDEQLDEIERSACPTCGSCSGMFTANSMNCLTEAIGLALPGNGSTLATHAGPQGSCSSEAGRLVVDLARRYYERRRRLGAAARHRHPGRVRERDGARRGHGRLDQHGAAPAGRRPRGRARLHASPTSTRSPPGARACARSRPNTPKYHMEDVHRAGGIPAILGELEPRRPAAPRRPHGALRRPWTSWLATWDIRGGARARGRDRAVPRRARRRAHDRAVLDRRTAGRAWTPTPRTAASATSSTPTRPTAAWPSCTATSPRTAAS